MDEAQIRDLAMDEARIRELACAHLEIEDEQVMSLRVYEDCISVVVNRGGDGCPKYWIPLADLAAPDQPPAEEKQVEPPKAPRKPRKRRASK